MKVVYSLSIIGYKVHCNIRNTYSGRDIDELVQFALTEYHGTGTRLIKNHDDGLIELLDEVKV